MGCLVGDFLEAVDFEAEKTWGVDCEEAVIELEEVRNSRWYRIRYYSQHSSNTRTRM